MEKQCVECGDNIGAARLRARPTATLCIECQAEMERTGRFVKHTIEIAQEIEGWEYLGQQEILVRGTKV